MQDDSEFIIRLKEAIQFDGRSVLNDLRKRNIDSVIKELRTIP